MARLFIYGGCVSRDTYEFIKQDHALVEYVARQSLISSTHPAANIPTDNHQLTSKFQTKQMLGDIHSSLPRFLRKNATKTDLLLLDLVIERVGVWQLPDGSYITRSKEFSDSGLQQVLPEGTVAVPFGSAEHFQLWRASVSKIYRLLERLGYLERTVILVTPWAEKTNTGEASRPFKKWTVAEINEGYQRYYNYVKKLGFKTLTIPDELVIADQNHRWGPDPYHYIKQAYDWIIEQLSPYLETEKK